MSDELSGAIEKLQQMMSSDDGQQQLQNILGMFSGGESEEKTAPSVNDSNSGGSQFDMSNMEMLMKMQRIMQSASGGSDKNTKFLTSLKPFLKESRQKKLDQAVKMMSVSKAMKMFGLMNREDGE